jgi:predicted ATPase
LLDEPEAALSTQNCLTCLRPSTHARTPGWSSSATKTRSPFD